MWIGDEGVCFEGGATIQPELECGVVRVAFGEEAEWRNLLCGKGEEGEGEEDERAHRKIPERVYTAGEEGIYRCFCEAVSACTRS